MDPLTITLISTTILVPVLSYLAHSRCTKIKTPCLELERSVLPPKADTDLAQK